ncbi:MAG: GAF domain-containing sensor histidine kinase [Anaerolineae bacterium]|nr:GAF domain-containing sensor histidine kinase [Anaerolineae bacterium]
MSKEETLPTGVGARVAVERLSALLVHQEPIGLASEALSIAINDLGARAGSICYLARPSLNVRRGKLSAAVTAHFDRWESSVEQRITTASWKVSEEKAANLAHQAVPGTDEVALHSLIVDDGRVVGTISLAYKAERVPEGNPRAMLAQFLMAVGRAINMTGALSLTKERLGQLTLFYQVAQSMASTFDLGKVLNDTMQLATAVLDASTSALVLIDQSSKELVFEYTHGEMGELLRKQRTGLTEGIAGWVASHGVPVVVNNARADARFSPKVDARTGFLTNSIVAAPIQIRGNTIGVLEALNKRSEGGFDSEDLSLMTTTANQAAIAIENAQLYQSLRDERDRIIQAQENVRRQVARNLHDGTVQFLSAISMGIDHLERLIELKPDAAREELQALRDLTRQATQQARLALFELRPLILETQGLIPALETYVQQLQGGESFGIHLEATPGLPELNNSTAIIVFVIIQEAVNNAKKHADARDVWLRISQDDGYLRVVIEDNGCGFDPGAVEAAYDRTGSIGLLTMRERADLIDGQLSIESSSTPPHTGTSVILSVPLARLKTTEARTKQED